MKLLLLGATGRTGKHVLNAALEKGYKVHCLSRNSDRVPQNDRVTVFEGNPINSEDLLHAMEGCTHVISTLNVSRKSDFPWAPLRTPKEYLSNVMDQLIPMAKSKSIEQVVICSAWGVAETKKDIPKWFKWFIDNSNIGAAYRDHERQEALLTQSSIPWTIIRPVGLTNSSKEQSIMETLNNHPKPSMTISRKSVAKYLVESLTRNELIGKKVVISKE